MWCWIVFMLVPASGLADLPQPSQAKLADGVARSADGLNITYTAGGAGEPALVFIHGGLADRSFWSGQLGPLAARHRVVAMDLAGHGTSASGRKRWTLRAFGEDVRAAADAAGVKRMILIGNSLGGPVAIEAARVMPGRVVAVVGVDTFQDLTPHHNSQAMRAQAEAFRKDFTGSCAKLTRQMFHADANPALVRDVRARLCKSSPDVIAGVLESLADYDSAEAARAANVPIRCLNGDLFQTNIEANRKVVPDFEVVSFAHTGHYPMLEKTAEFNRKLEALLEKLPH